MLICTYNIFLGGRETTLDSLFGFLQQLPCSVCVLNEANGWHAKWESVQEAAASHGFPQLELLRTPHGYDIAVAAAGAYEMRRGEHTVEGGGQSGFHHGVLHVTLAEAVEEPPLHLLATHLSPRSAQTRTHEAAQLASISRTLSPAPVVLAGDLNSLSPADEAAHRELLPRLQADPRLAQKFLTPARDAIAYEPLALLLAAGLVDLCRGEPGGGEHEPTVPTGVGEDDMHAAPMRLDYILASPAATQRRLAGLEGVVVRTELTRSASDHFPVALRTRPVAEGSERDEL